MIKTILLTLALLFFSCFGGVKQPETQQPVGFYPVLFSNVPPQHEFQRSKIMNEISNSLERIGFFKAVSVSGENVLTPENADSTSAFPFLIQINLEKANYSVERHTLIPFILYRPRLVFIWTFNVKIVNPAQKKFSYAGILTGKAEKKVTWDVVDYDATDPDLSLSAVEKQQFEIDALRNFVFNLNELLIKLSKQK